MGLLRIVPSRYLLLLLLAQYYAATNARITRSEAQFGRAAVPAQTESSPVERFVSASSTKILSVPIRAEHGLELYQHWTDQALSSLFACVANKKLTEIMEIGGKAEAKTARYAKRRANAVEQKFGECSKLATSVPLHAKCVSKLLKHEIKRVTKALVFDSRRSAGKSLLATSSSNKPTKSKIGRRKLRPSRPRLLRPLSYSARCNYTLPSRQALHPLQPFSHATNVGQTLPVTTNPTSVASAENDKWIGGFRLRPPRRRTHRRRHRHRRRLDEKSERGRARRIRRSIIVKQSDKYELKMPGGGMTPIGGVARMLMKTILAARGKSQVEVRPWQQVVERLRGVAQKRREDRKRLEEGSIEGLDQLAFRGLRQRGLAGDDLESIVADPKRLRTFLAKKRGDKASKPAEKLVQLLRKGMKLGYSIAGKNTSNFDEQMMKLLSPRFLSVVPERGTGDGGKDESIDFLSPSLFSLHNEGTGLENLTSMPNLIRGFSGTDQQEWMNLIVEAAGVVEQADSLERELKVGKTPSPTQRDQYEREIRAADGAPLYFTRANVTQIFGNNSYEVRKIDTFQELHRTLTRDQLREMNRTGYAMLTSYQLHLLYGPKSPYNNSETLARLSAMDGPSMHEGLTNDIHAAAEAKSFQLRQKDVVLSPTLFTFITLNPALLSQPIVLSPLVFSPIILSPAVLGPVILSPQIFSPLLLSPRVLSPVILTPLLFSPLLLSPFVLHPFILVPGVFAPLILSPLVLSPVILSPQVFTPLILSPFALSPFILTPTLGSPLILSPFVLSPIILSPQILGALILSPYALSPVLYSPLIAYSVILSPSYLS